MSLDISSTTSSSDDASNSTPYESVCREHVKLVLLRVCESSAEAAMQCATNGAFIKLLQRQLQHIHKERFVVCAGSICAEGLGKYCCLVWLILRLCYD